MISPVKIFDLRKAFSSRTKVNRKQDSGAEGSRRGSNHIKSNPTEQPKKKQLIDNEKAEAKNNQNGDSSLLCDKMGKQDQWLNPDLINKSHRSHTYPSIESTKSSKAIFIAC
jgi:hypothetical protein